MAVSVVLSLFAIQAIYNFLDAKMIACNSDGIMVYTSPNILFIPKPHNGDEELQAHVDGHFGPHQLFPVASSVLQGIRICCMHTSKRMSPIP